MIDFGGLKKSEVAIFECLNVIDEMQNVSVGAKFLANHILRQSEAWEVSWDYYAKLFNKSVKTIKSWRDELSNAGVWIVTNKNDIIFNNVVSKIDNLEKNDNFGKNSLIWKKTPILEKNDIFGKNFDKKEKNLLNLNFIKNKPTPAGVRACDTSIGEFSKPTQTLENPHFERDLSENSAENSQVENQINEISAKFQNSNEILNENKSISNQPLENSSENSQEFSEITGKNSQKAPLNLVGENEDNFAYEERLSEANGENVAGGVDFVSEGKDGFGDFSEVQGKKNSENGTKAGQSTARLGLLEIIKNPTSQPKNTAAAINEYMQGRGQGVKQNGDFHGTQAGQGKNSTQGTKQTEKATAREKILYTKEAKFKSAMRFFENYKGEIKHFTKDDWTAWVEYRIARMGSNAFTERTWKNSINTLLKLGENAKTAIDTSIERGWSGLFEPKQNLTFSPQQRQRSKIWDEDWGD